MLPNKHENVANVFSYRTFVHLHGYEQFPTICNALSLS